MKAVRVKEYGGPEVMCYEDIDVPDLGANDVLVKVEAAGINYIDTYQRSGLYQIPLPATLGLEAGGTVIYVVVDTGQGEVSSLMEESGLRLGGERVGHDLGQ